MEQNPQQPLQPTVNFEWAAVGLTLDTLKQARGSGLSDGEIQMSAMRVRRFFGSEAVPTLDELTTIVALKGEYGDWYTVDTVLQVLRPPTLWGGAAADRLRWLGSLGVSGPEARVLHELAQQGAYSLDLNNLWHVHTETGLTLSEIWSEFQRDKNWALVRTALTPAGGSHK